LTDKKDLENSSFVTKLGNLFLRKLLGKGKSGYSYLAEFNNKNFVLKLMHNELCQYYSFGEANKVALEIDAYDRLKRCGILLPELLIYDTENNYLIKEFIDGKLASDSIAENQIPGLIIKQLFEMYRHVKDAGLNIDYFPSNFIIRNQELFYIDYECNPYDPEWDLPNWGIYYWANSEGFRKYFLEGDIMLINESPETGKPLKKPYEKKVADWIEQYGTSAKFQKF
jgi:predicted Ser/Thr protein kinase